MCVCTCTFVCACTCMWVYPTTEVIIYIVLGQKRIKDTNFNLIHNKYREFPDNGPFVLGLITKNGSKILNKVPKQDKQSYVWTWNPAFF